MTTVAERVNLDVDLDKEVRCAGFPAEPCARTAAWIGTARCGTGHRYSKPQCGPCQIEADHYARQGWLGCAYCSSAVTITWRAL